MNQTGLTISNKLKVHSGPGRDHGIVDEIAHNTRVAVVETESDEYGFLWHCIGSNRWIDAGWVRLLTPISS